MKRRDIAKILKRNHGSKTVLAKRADVGLTAISAWLRGGVSKNISDHAEAYARELLLKEEADRIAKGEANGPSVRAKLEDLRKNYSGAE